MALHEIDPEAAGEAPASPEATTPVVGNEAGVRGRVVDTDGSGLPAVVTVVDPHGRQRARVRTGADGGFALDVPDDGWWQMVVAADGFAPYAGRIAGGTHDVVVLRPSRTARR